MKVSEIEYKRADVAQEIKLVTEATEAVKNAESGKEIVEIRAALNKSHRHFSTMYLLSYFRRTLNVNDKFYEKEQEYYDENMPLLSAAEVKFTKAILSSPHFEDVKNLLNPLIIENMRASLLVMDDKIIDDCKKENKLTTEYDKLISSLLFDWQGKKVPLAVMHGACKDASRETRKAAYAVLGNTLKKVGKKIDDIFDKLVKVRTSMAKKMGFSNFVEMGDKRIGHLAYGRKEIAEFRNSVLCDVVPTVTELKERLSKKLGIDRIRFYDNDIYCVGGNVDPVGTSEELIEKAQTMYNDMDDKLAETFSEMRGAGSVDYKSRDGKKSGGYCDILSDYGLPIIFANFNGTMDDVAVLTHEFGHAYAFKRAYVNDIDDDLNVGGMEVAETHSMAMEALSTKYYNLFYGDRVKDATYQEIFDAFDFLTYGVIVDYFQELVYTSPDMSKDERKKLWLKLEAQFRPYIDMTDTPYICEGGRWQYQAHIFDSPFYYIDYCLSTCLALQFGELATKDFSLALKKYLALVEHGGTKTIDVLAHEAGFVSPFDAGALKQLCNDIKAHLEALE